MQSISTAEDEETNLLTTQHSLEIESKSKSLSKSMEGGRREMMSLNISGGSSWRRAEYGRPIPKRGQVKAAIVSGLAHSLSSMFRSHS